MSRHDAHPGRSIVRWGGVARILPWAFDSAGFDEESRGALRILSGTEGRPGPAGTPHPALVAAVSGRDALECRLPCGRVELAVEPDEKGQVRGTGQRRR